MPTTYGGGVGESHATGASGGDGGRNYGRLERYRLRKDIDLAGMSAMEGVGIVRLKERLSVGK